MFQMMLCPKQSHARIVHICVLSFVLSSLPACTATNQNNRQQYSTQLQAENSMMKKRLPLMERESDVLNKENEQLRIKLQESGVQNKQLAEALVSLREQYKNDMIVGEEQIRSLEEILEKIEQENRAAIDALLADNKVLQETMVKERRAQKDQLAMQKAASDKQREEMVRENGRKEAELTAKLAAANQKVTAMGVEIASLKSSYSEISDKLAKANALTAELVQAREASQAELNSIKAAGMKARSEYLAQLESIKTTNVELNKKITELSGDLSRPKQPEPKLQ